MGEGRGEECRQGAVYILFVRGWHLPTSHSLAGCACAHASLHSQVPPPRQGALCFGQARTHPNRAGRSAHQAFVPRHGGCEPRKVDNGELSRIDPSRQIVLGPTRNIHPVSTRQSPCKDRPTLQSCTVTKRLKSQKTVPPPPALPTSSTPASTHASFPSVPRNTTPPRPRQHATLIGHYGRLPTSKQPQG
jgi:hypothetical protein